MPDITISEAVEQPTAAIRERVAVQDMTRFFGRAFGAVMAALSAQGIEPAGPPFALYRGMPGETVDVEAGIPVASALKAAGDVRPGSLPAGRVYRATHVGPYDTLEETYNAILARIQDDGAVPSDLMWEYYLTDPGEVPDPAQWRTDVCWPVLG